MKIYLSSFTNNILTYYNHIWPEDKLNILLSYGLRNGSFYPLMSENSMINSLIIDSGTFTMNMAKHSEKYDKRISFTGYVSFLNNVKCSFAFGYDKFFHPQDWKKNLQFLKAYGGSTRIVPVVHSYSREEISTYLSIGFKIIALGYSDKKTRTNIHKCSNYIFENGGECHLLGSTDEKLLSTNPIAYCDSSSWAKNSQYGQIAFNFENENLKINLKNSKPIQREIFERYIKEETSQKLNIRDIIHDRSIWRRVINARHYVKMQKRVSIAQKTKKF